MYYQTAHVVLVGNSGVGKSGLASVLGEDETGFMLTSSTHGRSIRRMSHEMVREGEEQILREIWLWDLAGQPIYRLVHQIYLGGATVGVVLFDAQSETDPEAGVADWCHFLRAQTLFYPDQLPIEQILVAARMDNPGRRSSQERIQKMVGRFHFAHYVETSAKWGHGIAALQSAIARLIQWENLPRYEVPSIFPRLAQFALSQPARGQVFADKQSLYLAFSRSASLHERDFQDAQQSLLALESNHLVRRLSFHKRFLLAPSYLDAYTSALANTVQRNEYPAGQIMLKSVLAGEFYHPSDIPTLQKHQERILLQAVVEDVLRQDIAFLRQEDRGLFLTFPSCGSRPLPSPPNEDDPRTIYSFEGALLHVFATLASRLSRAEGFRFIGAWNDLTVTYEALDGGVCSMSMPHVYEGRGELHLFFSSEVRDESRLLFEYYVALHLQRLTFPDRVKRDRSLVCPGCRCVIPSRSVRLRMERGKTDMACSVCDSSIKLAEEHDPLEIPKELIEKIDLVASQARDREVAMALANRNNFVE